MALVTRGVHQSHSTFCLHFYLRWVMNDELFISFPRQHALLGRGSHKHVTSESTSYYSQDGGHQLFTHLSYLRLQSYCHNTPKNPLPNFTEIKDIRSNHSQNILELPTQVLQNILLVIRALTQPQCDKEQSEWQLGRVDL